MRFVDAEKAKFGTRRLCRVLGVGRERYRRRQRGEPSARATRKERLMGQIDAVFWRMKGRYGSPRVWEELVAAGVHISKRRVAELMREMGLKALSAPRFKVTTNSNHGERISPNLLKRNFEASSSNRV